MNQDKAKLIKIMKSLEADYKSGKISKEKFEYFYGKYGEKLRSMEKGNHIPNNQNKKRPNNHPNIHKKNIERSRLENEKLVEKYIVGPKKNAGEKVVNPSSNKGIYSILVVLVLIVGFSVGIGFGIFNLGFDNVSLENSAAIVEDTAFLKVEVVNNTGSNNPSSNQNSGNENNNPVPAPEPEPPAPEPEPAGHP